MELIDRVARKIDAPKRLISDVVNTFIDELIEGIVESERVEIRGLGVFVKSKMKPRRIINVATKEETVIDELLRVKFKPSRNLVLKVRKQV
jgi:nucleoid DNA-binding protein